MKPNISDLTLQIKYDLAVGKSPELIKQTLVQNGHNPKDIDDILKALSGSARVSRTPTVPNPKLPNNSSAKPTVNVAPQESSAVVSLPDPGFFTQLLNTAFIQKILPNKWLDPLSRFISLPKRAGVRMALIVVLILLVSGCFVAFREIGLYKKISEPKSSRPTTLVSPKPVAPSNSSSSQTQAKPAVPKCTDPSGQCMPVGNIQGWNEVFSDDFTTNVPVGEFSGCTGGKSLPAFSCSGLPASVNSQWSVIPDGGVDTSGHGQFWPSKVLSIENGLLNIHLHTEDGVHMGASIRPKIPGSDSQGGMTGGRYVVRFRADNLYGYRTAWGLWPTPNTTGNSNIIFPGNNLSSPIAAYIDQANGPANTTFKTKVLATSWHTCVIQWMPKSGEIQFYLDGSLIGTAKKGVPTSSMFWDFKTETAEDGTTPSASEAGNVQIDWVVAYSAT